MCKLHKVQDCKIDAYFVHFAMMCLMHHTGSPDTAGSLMSDCVVDNCESTVVTPAVADDSLSDLFVVDTVVSIVVVENSVVVVTVLVVGGNSVMIVDGSFVVGDFVVIVSVVSNDFIVVMTVVGNNFVVGMTDVGMVIFVVAGSSVVFLKVVGTTVLSNFVVLGDVVVVLTVVGIVVTMTDVGTVVFFAVVGNSVVVMTVVGTVLSTEVPRSKTQHTNYHRCSCDNQCYFVVKK